MLKQAAENSLEQSITFHVHPLSQTKTNINSLRPLHTQRSHPDLTHPCFCSIMPPKASTSCKNPQCGTKTVPMDIDPVIAELIGNLERRNNNQPSGKWACEAAEGDVEDQSTAPRNQRGPPLHRLTRSLPQSILSLTHAVLAKAPRPLSQQRKRRGRLMMKLQLQKLRLKMTSSA